MADAIHELLATDVARDKLGRRGIALLEAAQLLRNRHVVVSNLRGHPHRPQRAARRLLVGETNGGRSLSLVVEATDEPTTWLLITGWEATAVERRLIRNR